MLPVMSGVPVPARLPRRGLATSELNRAIPPYQSGPFDRLGRGQRMAEDPTPNAHTPFRVQAGGCRPAASPSIEESGGHDPHCANSQPLSKRRRPPGRFALQIGSPPGVNRQGIEEDGRLERHCCHSRPVSGRGQSPDWFIFRGRRAT